MLTIALCGNHKLSYCTETDLAWTFEQMGYTVLRFQENEQRTEDMLEACLMQHVQLFLYVHTHGWKTPGTMDLNQLIGALRVWGVKTASFHLDRYWGLDKADKRESRIGQHPFWHTDMVFTADGNHQEAFMARGVRHEWLPPAIAARHCFRGVCRPEFACDVAFVGQRNYHPEYPFRRQLIAWLEKTYGSRFKRFAGDAGGVVREAKLNDLYASAKVVVGDSCFAGAPYYWSDRVPETLGRGGFLIHPATEGLSIPGLVTFPAGDFAELKYCIDHFVNEDAVRRVHTDHAMADVQAHHTYTNRMATLLMGVGL